MSHALKIILSLIQINKCYLQARKCGVGMTHAELFFLHGAVQEMLATVCRHPGSSVTIKHTKE